MSFVAEAWAWEQQPGDAGTKMLLLALARYADHSDACWPTHAQLTEDTGATAAEVAAGLDRLEAAGLIRRESRGVGKSARIILQTELAIAMARQAPERVAG